MQEFNSKKHRFWKRYQNSAKARLGLGLEFLAALAATVRTNQFLIRIGSPLGLTKTQRSGVKPARQRQSFQAALSRFTQTFKFAGPMCIASGLQEARVDGTRVSL